MIAPGELVTGGAVGVLAWWGTGRYLRYALSRGILDVPNARSSHRKPTPRGGGLAIVAAAMAGFIALAGARTISPYLLAALLGGGMVIALVGFLDDRRKLGAHWRLLGHACAAVWLVAALGQGNGMEGPSTDPFIHLGLWGDALAVLYVVWMVNLTNFMDGIDGLAASECAAVALGGCALVLAAGARPGAPLVLAAACAGFLVWNWPPARIFMGDAGSGFLGFTLAALSLESGTRSLDLFWGWVILAGVFVADATLTLLRRMLRRERFYEAHRSHAYQHAAAGFGHRRVTLAVLSINVFWLLPLAMLVVLQLIPVWAGVAASFVPLVAVAAALGAGTPGPVSPASPRGAAPPA